MAMLHTTGHRHDGPGTYRRHSHPPTQRKPFFERGPAPNKKKTLYGPHNPPPDVPAALERAELLRRQISRIERALEPARPGAEIDEKREELTPEQRQGAEYALRKKMEEMRYCEAFAEENGAVLRDLQRLLLMMQDGDHEFEPIELRPEELEVIARFERYLDRKGI